MLRYGAQNIRRHGTQLTTAFDASRNSSSRIPKDETGGPPGIAAVSTGVVFPNLDSEYMSVFTQIISCWTMSLVSVACA